MRQAALATGTVTMSEKDLQVCCAFIEKAKASATWLASSGHFDLSSALAESVPSRLVETDPTRRTRMDLPSAEVGAQ